jgi:hypothetical protein
MELGCACAAGGGNGAVVEGRVGNCRRIERGRGFSFAPRVFFGAIIWRAANEERAHSTSFEVFFFEGKESVINHL